MLPMNLDKGFTKWADEPSYNNHHVGPLLVTEPSEIHWSFLGVLTDNMIPVNLLNPHARTLDCGLIMKEIMKKEGCVFSFLHSHSVKNI